MQQATARRGVSDGKADFTVANGTLTHMDALNVDEQGKVGARECEFELLAAFDDAEDVL